MKKISPKIVTLAIMILSLVTVGALGIHKTIAPPGGGWEHEYEPTGGG